MYVEHKVLPGSSDDLKVLEISPLKKKPPVRLMAGAGIGTDGTSFQFAVKENNWLGRGIKLQSELNLSDKQGQWQYFSEIIQNYKYSGNSVLVALDVSSTDRSSTTGFTSSRTGFTLGTSFEQYENIFFSPRNRT